MLVNLVNCISQTKPNQVNANAKPSPQTGMSPPSSSKEQQIAAQKKKLVEQWEHNKRLKEADDAFLKTELNRLNEVELQVLENHGALQSHEAYTRSHELLQQGKVDEYIALLQKAAERSHRKALYELGSLYEYGELVDRDFSKAVRYYKRSAELGDPAGQRAYAFMLDHGRRVPQNKGKAVLYYTFAANNYDTEASLVLGNKLHRGYDTTKSCDAAIKYYRHAANQVIEEYMKTPFVHSLHFESVSIPNRVNGLDSGHISREEILEYVKFNANPDNAKSLVEIGILYLFGYYGQEVDYAVAKDYFEQVEDVEPRAQAMLGRLYEFGLGVDADAQKAEEYYSRAAEKDNVQGIFFLGELYLTGNGIEKDYERAYELFVQAAKIGIPEAHLNLGIMYFEGYGVNQDFEKASSYFKSVLASGLSTTTARAEYYHAEMLHYGIGMHPDCNAALMKYRSVTDKGKHIKKLEVAYSAYEEDNIELALAYYEKLSEMGNGVAQANAGWIYDEYQKEGIMSTDFGNSLDLAVKFYSRAADQGNEYSHLRLGDYYYYGIGNITVDYSKAASYYRYIGNHHPQAHFNLGYMHQYGEGVKKDIYLAKRYYDHTLQMQPDAFLSVYFCLFNIGIEYATQLYSEGKHEQLMSDMIDYFVPRVYFDFYEQIMQEWYGEEEMQQTSNPNSHVADSKGKPKSPVIGFLDRESVFGYNWDTVLIFTIGTILCITLLFRFGIIQIQIV